MLSAYFNQTTGFNTPKKGATVKGSIISELKEVKILEHTVIMNSTFTGMRHTPSHLVKAPFLLETQIRDIERK